MILIIYRYNELYIIYQQQRIQVRVEIIDWLDGCFSYLVLDGQEYFFLDESK